MSLGIPSAFAEMPMSGPSPMPTQTQSVDLIGVAAAVRGTVELSRTGTVGKVIESGENIFLGDQITTGGKGRLQILLLDETVFTIGPNSAMTIDQFVYDPANHDGEIKAKIVKGTFRFVTGQIAHKKPSRMRVDLPAGSIGVRGTIVAGQVEGMHSFVALMGPGDGNNAGANQGSIVLSNEVNGQTVEETVNRTGYGSVIEGEGSAPSSAFQVPAEQMNNLVSNFSPGPSDQSGGASGSGGNSGSSSSDINVGSVSAAGGENTFAALGSVNDLTLLEETISNIGNETDPARQNIADPSITSGNSGSSGTIPGDSGPGDPDLTYFYSGSGFELSDGSAGGGNYQFYLEIDPGSGGSFGGDNSYVKNDGACTIGSNPIITFDFKIDETNFVPGQTTYTFNALADNEISDTVMNAQEITFTFSSDPSVGAPSKVTHIVSVSGSGNPMDPPPLTITNSPAGEVSDIQSI